MTTPDLSTREGRDQMRREAEDELYGDCHTVVTALWLSRSLSILDALDNAKAASAILRKDWLTLSSDTAAWQQRATHAEAALQRVREACDGLEHYGAMGERHTARAARLIRGALNDGDPSTPCGRGPCALGDGHTGNCRM